MLNEPRLEYKSPAQTYMGIRARVTMDEMATVVPALFPEVRQWLGAKGVPTTGAPFIRYNVIDMERYLDVEVGWPVAAALPGDDRVSAGIIPAGRYAEALNTGHYDKLMDATGQFLAWADANGVVWQKSGEGKDEVWGGRFEFYLSDPNIETNPDKWETVLAFLVADAPNG